MSDLPRTYDVQPKDREPLIRWMKDALVACGCRIIRASASNQAPFRISFMLPNGERMGIVAYAFLANSKVTRNRPEDEHRFQVKYGSDSKSEHEIWQDPFGLYTTLFVGINPDRGFFVGADPVVHSPTKFFISVEFNERRVEEIERDGWAAWERDRRTEDSRPGRRTPRQVSEDADSPVEVFVGGGPQSFLRYVMFEREALGEDQGHRKLIAERSEKLVVVSPSSTILTTSIMPTPERLHELAREFDMTAAEVLDLIARTPYAKMAVRGSVAEEHLVRKLSALPGITEAQRVEGKGEVDVSVRLDGGRPLRIQCKNVLRDRTKDGLARVDFQRTRASKADPCSRYYAPGDFDVVAACLHAVSEEWTFSYVLPTKLTAHKTCIGKIASAVRVDDRWSTDARRVFREVG